MINNGEHLQRWPSQFVLLVAEAKRSFEFTWQHHKLTAYCLIRMNSKTAFVCIFYCNNIPMNVGESSPFQPWERNTYTHRIPVIFPSGCHLLFLSQQSCVVVLYFREAIYLDAQHESSSATFYILLYLLTNWQKNPEYLSAQCSFVFRLKIIRAANK